MEISKRRCNKDGPLKVQSSSYFWLPWGGICRRVDEAVYQNLEEPVRLEYISKFCVRFGQCCEICSSTFSIPASSGDDSVTRIGDAACTSIDGGVYQILPA